MGCDGVEENRRPTGLLTETKEKAAKDPTNVFRTDNFTGLYCVLPDLSSDPPPPTLQHDSNRKYLSNIKPLKVLMRSKRR